MIFVRRGNECECMELDKFYSYEIEPMIRDPGAYGNREWSNIQMLFFNIPNKEKTSSKDMMKAKSQMRDYIRHFRPSYERFSYLIKRGEHPLVEMTKYPELYGKEFRQYLFERSDNREVEIKNYLNNIRISYRDERELI